MKRARFTKEARTEFLAQTAYYEAIRSDLAARFRKEVETTAHRAAAFPGHGRPAAGDTRRRRVARFPFSLFYRETEDGILILAVASDLQRPEYWLGRAPRGD